MPCRPALETRSVVHTAPLLQDRYPVILLPTLQRSLNYFGEILVKANVLKRLLQLKLLTIFLEIILLPFLSFL